MRVVAQSDTNVGEILAALADSTIGVPAEVRLAVAYISYQGACTLVRRLQRNWGADWKNARKSIVTCFDYGISEPQALKYLQALDNASVSIRNIDVLKTKGLFPSVAFHPKTYLYFHATNATMFSGSANLTSRALTSNTEAGILEYPVSLAEAERCWGVLSESSVPLTPTLLAEYQRRRKRLRVPVSGDRVSKPQSRPLGDRQSFADAFESGSLVLGNWSRLWIQGGTMSGGSKSQLELPRHANEFFGFGFSNYTDKHQKIGKPILVSGRREWTDRPLTWHGNNRMERLNLPTAANGGFNYVGSAICFRRIASGYELEVDQWDGDLARAWRSASEKLRRVYRVGGSNRICGVF